MYAEVVEKIRRRRRGWKYEQCYTIILCSGWFHTTKIFSNVRHVLGVRPHVKGRIENRFFSLLRKVGGGRGGQVPVRNSRKNHSL